MSFKSVLLCAMCFLFTTATSANEICTPPSEKTLRGLGAEDSFDGFKISAPKSWVLTIDRDSQNHETDCKWSPNGLKLPLLELQHRDAAPPMRDLNAGLEELTGVKRVMLNLPKWEMSRQQDCTIGKDVYRCVHWKGQSSDGKKYFGFIYLTVTEDNKAVTLWGTADKESQLAILSAAAKSFR